MKISIIIPTYKEAGAIGRLMDHILSVTAGAGIEEVIVVDAPSGDGIENVLSKYNMVKYHASAKKGRAAQMNAGAAIARGDVLYFLHADSYPPKGFDAHISERVRNGVESGCYRMKFDSDHHLLKFSAWFTRFPNNVFRGGDQSLFITRTLFDKLSGFNEDLMIMEDYDLVTRVRKTARFGIIPHKLVTSARKYQRNGVYRLQFLFSVIQLMYRTGFSQERIAGFYSRHIFN